jgi:tyrosinase
MTASSQRRAMFSRRQALVIVGSATVGSLLPKRLVFGQPAAGHRRLNVTNPAASAALESYKKAIAAMLSLPPTDPRNWYRNAIIHELDCPHHNWWFLPWHRGYLGWFEKTCRELSGDRSFTLPYWDWTALPQIPKQMFDGVLNPGNSPFLDGYGQFKSKFMGALGKVWNGFNADQSQQLKLRNINNVDDLFKLLDHDFVSQNAARELTADDPDLDALTKDAVSKQKLTSALAARSFYSILDDPNGVVGFGSYKSSSHSEGVGEGILESQPHDNVHGAVGGFMGAYLSPVDPLFFLHHANLDRIWDTWTRKQLAAGLPVQPIGADKQPWEVEPFLFFVDSQGQAVSKMQAGDYASIGDFDYDYEPGSGEEVLQRPQPAQEFKGETIRATVSRSTATSAQMIGHAVAPVSDRLLSAVVARSRHLVARIRLQLPANSTGVQYHVLLNAPENAEYLKFDSPNYCGTITLFGHHAGVAMKPIVFDVPLTGAIGKLGSGNLLTAHEPIRISVVAGRRGVQLAPVEGTLASVSLAVF